jgi:hypothetical protein
MDGLLSCSETHTSLTSRSGLAITHAFRRRGAQWSRDCRPLYAIIFLCVSHTTVATAQTAEASVIVRGAVVDSLSGLPLPRATVAIGQTEQATDFLGHFVIRSVTPGTQAVRVRRVGYREYSSTISVGAGDTTLQHFALQAVPMPLTEVTIEGKVIRVPRVFEAPYQRAARGDGRFFTKEDIEKLNPADVRSLLNLVPGISANDRGVTFQRCQAGLPSPSLAFGAGASSGVPSAGAKVQVWIDGYRVTGRSTSPTAESLIELLATVPPSAVEIIEIYSGVTRIPVDFLNDACAVIAIWTKRY